MNLFPSLSAGIKATKNYLLHTGNLVVTEKWQGKQNMNNAFWEALHWTFSAPIPYTIPELENQVKPNQPWADEQFKERLSGKPLNPGESYKIWPFYNDAGNKFRENEKFDHTYMERFWPKHAGADLNMNMGNTNFGIRFKYGDFNDVIALLKNEPNTRQAFLPIWFPEDTGVQHGGRVPCTIGYHFIRRLDGLHIEYWIRACDYFRHFRDDIYLAARLVYVILNELAADDPWKRTVPGFFTMHISSLHIFATEINRLKNETD